MSAAPFTADLHVRWSDQDLNGHVNNARVLTLVEELRLQALATWGLGVPDPARPRVIRSLEATFDRPVHYGEPLLGRAWIARIGRTSFTVGHELVQRESRCVAMDAVLVRLDAATGRPAPFDEEFRLRLEQASPTG